jgi:E3 ubiquitin-protein ligase SHPRH
VGEKHGIGSDNLIQSKATLIITPPSILSQWKREIKRHTRVQDKDGNFRSLKVLTYAGVKEICNMSHKQAKESGQRQLMHSQYLSNADIVLTTFQTLMSELTHSNDNPYVPSGETNLKRQSRRGKRYRIVPSPLINIKWWRVVLDEAQRVETPTAASARMALKLASHHRWAISGTPVGRGKVDDLYGLLLFLRTTPFDHKSSFKVSLKSSHPDVNDRIRYLLHDVLWRSTKANNAVREQMGIPEMTEKKLILKFSSVEKHFYMRQLEDTLLAAQPIFLSTGKRQKEKDLEVLSHSLRRLRAACCHPQVSILVSVN